MGLFPHYKVARASQYLAITGWRIKDVKLAKKAFLMWGQTCTTFDITPLNYAFDVQAMSAQKLPFILPAVFTIGPKEDDQEMLLKYAKLLASHDTNSNHVHNLVQGVIEGETSVLAASMTMEEIFKGTKDFKLEVFDKVQVELNKFGLLIYNVNVKQLVDVPGYEYFSYLGQKTQMEAANQAKIDISEAKMKGEIGSKQRDGEVQRNALDIDTRTKKYVAQRKGDGLKQEAKVRAEIKIYENQREAEVAEANAALATKKAEWDKQTKVAEVTLVKAVAAKEAELRLEVEKKNAMRQTEKLKAEFLSKATVDYEVKVQEANWDLYKKQKAAEAALYQQKKEAEGHLAMVDATVFTRQQEADVEFYFKKKEAEALVATTKAKGDGELSFKQKEAEALVATSKAKGFYVKNMLQALGGNYAALRDYLMIEGGMYKDIAKFNVEAVKGMQPKISVWSSGEGSANFAGGEKGGNDCGVLKEIAGVYKMLPPLLSTVQEQTGMVPPWLATLPSNAA